MRWKNKMMRTRRKIQTHFLLFSTFHLLKWIPSVTGTATSLQALEPFLPVVEVLSAEVSAAPAVEVSLLLIKD